MANQFRRCRGLISCKATEIKVSTILDDSDPNQPSLKIILSELLKLIEEEKDLSDDDKAEALKQLPILSEAGQNPKDNILKTAAKTSIKILKGTITSLPDTAKLVESCAKLLPLIAKLFEF